MRNPAVNGFTIPLFIALGVYAQEVPSYRLHTAFTFLRWRAEQEIDGDYERNPIAGTYPCIYEASAYMTKTGRWAWVSNGFYLVRAPGLASFDGKIAPDDGSWFLDRAREFLTHMPGYVPAIQTDNKGLY